MAEIGVYAQGETISGPDSAYALRKLQRMLDAWNADELSIYNKTFVTYTIPTGRTPNSDKSVNFTIGPSAADFATTGTRPVAIESANIILTGTSPYVKSPLEIRDDGWWHSQRVPGVSSQLPTDLYYSPDFPNGKIYLWPVETIAYLLELELWQNLTAFTKLTDTFTFPPGYEKAIVLSLAEELGPGFGSPYNVGPAAAKARAAIQSLNSEAPKLNLSEGVPTGGRGLSSWNFRTGGSR